MRTYLIDTNALLSFVTNRNAAQQEKISLLLELAALSKCKMLCHQHVITEFVYVLDKVYHRSKETINQIVEDLISMPGIEIRTEIDFKILLGIWPKSISDFGDAVVATLWLSNRESSIVTFDKKFTKELEQIGADVFSGMPTPG